MSADVQPLSPRDGAGVRAAALTAAAAAVVALATAVGTVAARQGLDPGTVAERELPLIVVLLCLGALIAGPGVAWAARTERPTAAVGLAVATLAGAMPVWAGWSWLPMPVRPVLLAALPLAVAGPAQVGLRWRPGRNRPALRLIWALAAVAAGLHALAYNPFTDPRCDRTCADVPAVLDGVLPTTTAVTVTTALVVLAAAGTVAALAVPRSGAPVVVRIAVALAELALAGGAVVRARGLGGPATVHAVVVVDLLVVGVVAAAAGYVLARAARARAAVERLIGQLADPDQASAPGTPAWLREVHFAVPDEGRWVDRSGAEIHEPGSGWEVVVLRDAAGAAVRLLLAPGTDAGDVLTRMSPAQRLALTNARLTAVARARLADLQAWQRRAVVRADAELFRIERDLHDGAQQRLVGTAFHLSLARAHATPAQRQVLDLAQDEIQRALDRLRRMTHGPFPPALADDGLPAALSDLAQDSAVPVALTCGGDLRVTADVARAVYAVVAGAVADLPPGEPRSLARVTVIREDDALRVRAELRPASTSSANDTDLADRVGAIGGSYRRDPGPGTTTITAVVPCGP